MFIGQSRQGQPSTVKISQGDDQRAIVIVTAVGTPVREALALAGMSANGRIIQLETDVAAPIVARGRAPADFQALDLWVEQLASIPDAGKALRIHWLIAGRSRPEVQAWMDKIVKLIDVLRKLGGLQAALLLTPFQWQSPLLAKLSSDRCCGWKRKGLPLHNTNHGGRIETDHWLTLWAPVGTMEAFHMPIETREGPGTLDEILDDDLNPSDALWLEDVTAKPMCAQRAQKTRFSAQVERFLHPKCSARSSVGYPVYARGDPAPSVAFQHPSEKLFNAPFTV